MGIAETKYAFYAFPSQFGIDEGMQVMGRPLDSLRIALDSKHQIMPTVKGCKGYCGHYYQDQKVAQGRSVNYAKQGRKYCSSCGFTTAHKDTRCRCCKNIFRARGKNRKTRPEVHRY